MLRPAAQADREAVLALGVAEEKAWFGLAESTAAEVGEWVDEEGGIASGVVLVEGVEAGRIRAFAAPGRHGTCILMVEPGSASDALDVMLPWLRERSSVQVIAFGADCERVAAFEREGLRHIRSSFTLARAADVPVMPVVDPPHGTDISPYSLGDDDDAVHRLIYVDAAWGSVPGHIYRDLDEWREAVSPGLRASLARRDGVPVGWVAGRILDGGRGYISGLAVSCSHRRRGLGRTLLVRGCADLLAAGANGIALDAVAANYSALQLYRSVGFAVEREWRTYADLPAD